MNVKAGCVSKIYQSSQDCIHQRKVVVCNCLPVIINMGFVTVPQTATAVSGESQPRHPETRKLRSAEGSPAEQFSLPENLLHSRQAMSNWTDVLTEGLIPPLLDQLTECDALFIAHLRATCQAWRKHCSRHLTHLELTPLPVNEFENLAQLFPNVHSITISRGRANVRGCWIQTEHIKLWPLFLL